MSTALPLCASSPHCTRRNTPLLFFLLCYLLVATDVVPEDNHLSISLGTINTPVYPHHRPHLHPAHPLPPPSPSPSRFLRNRLKQANDAAVKNLSSLRALYRLSLASGGGGAGMLGGGGDATDGGEGGAAAAATDPHPHITALATVLGEGSKLMVKLAESSLGDGVMEPVAELLHKDSKAQVSGGRGRRRRRRYS